MSKTKGKQVPGSEAAPFYVFYYDKDQKYRLYQKKEDGTWSDSIGGSKKGYNGLVELQTKAKEKQATYIKELESKTATPPAPSPEEKGREELAEIRAALQQSWLFGDPSHPGLEPLQVAF